MAGPNSSFLDPLLSPTHQDDGTDLPRRANINFIGFDVEDDPDNNATKITSTGGGGAGSVIALADHAAFRALSSVADGTVIHFQSPVGTFVYESTTGAGQADDDKTILKLTAVTLGSNGRAYSVDAPILPTIAALRLAVSGVNSTVQVQNYANAGDGGGGIFDKVSGTITDDGGINIQPTGAGFHYERRTDRFNFKPEWFGLVTDGTTNNAASLASAVSAIGDTSTTRAGRLQMPNRPVATQSTLALVRKSFILQGAGAGTTLGPSSLLRWRGTSTDPLIKVNRCQGSKVRDIRLMGYEEHQPSAAINFDVAGGELTPHNTAMAVEHVWIGGASGEDVRTMASTLISLGTSPAVTISGPLTPVVGIYLKVTTAGARGTAKVKISLFGKTTGAGWLDVNGDLVVEASAFEFTTAANLQIPDGSPPGGFLAWSLNFATGTYNLNDTYVVDLNQFAKGITFTGAVQDDQSVIYDCLFQDIKDVCIDIANPQSTIISVRDCKFNACATAIQTLSRGLRVEGCFFSSIGIYKPGACFTLAGDSGVHIRNMGAEGCARLITGSLGTGLGVDIEGEYFQCGQPVIDTGDGRIIDLQFASYVRIANMNFSGADGIANGFAKIKLRGPHVTLILENVGWYDGDTITKFLAHLDLTTESTGDTRLLIFDYNGARYVNFWTHGDAVTTPGARIDIGGPGVDPSIPYGRALKGANSSGSLKSLLSMQSSGKLLVGDGTTPTIYANDLSASVAGLSFQDFSYFLGIGIGGAGRIEFSRLNDTPKIVVEQQTTDRAVPAIHIRAGKPKASGASGTNKNSGDILAELEATTEGGGVVGSFKVLDSSGAQMFRVSDGVIGLYTATPVTQAARPGQLTDNTGGTAGNTLAAIPDPADTPISADALRDDLVANTLPPIRNDIASLRAKINAIEAALSAAGGGIGVTT